MVIIHELWFRVFRNNVEAKSCRAKYGSDNKRRRFSFFMWIIFWKMVLVNRHTVNTRLQGGNVVCVRRTLVDTLKLMWWVKARVLPGKFLSIGAGGMWRHKHRYTRRHKTVWTWISVITAYWSFISPHKKLPRSGASSALMDANT